MTTDRRVAVVGDDELSERVATIAEGLLPRPAVDVVADLHELTTIANPPHAVVVGPALVQRGLLADLAIAHERDPLAATVLVADRELRAPAQALVRSGAVDLLREPSDQELALSVERALQIGATRRPGAADAAAGGVPAPVHRVVTVASATGGCGKTFYAVNLAYFLHHHLGRSVCVVDLDLQFGEVSTALRLRPEATIFDLVHSDLSDEDLGEHLSDYIVTHESGIQVLAAPRDPSEADEVTPRDAARVVRALRTRFDDVIVDTPGSLNEIVLAAFDQSDELVVMVTPDVPSVRNLNVFLQTLARLKVPSERIAVVMNKGDRQLGIDFDEVERLLERKFRMVLPYAREVSRSINLGTPVLSYSPETEISRRLREGIVESLPTELRASVDDDLLGGGRSRFRLPKIFGGRR